MPTDAAEDHLRSIYRIESRAGPPVSTSQIAESAAASDGRKAGGA